VLLNYHLIEQLTQFIGSRKTTKLYNRQKI